MKPWSRVLPLLAAVALGPAGAGSAGCLPTHSTLQVQVEPHRADRTLPLRVGMLPPIDSRPEAERRKPFSLRISSMMVTPYSAAVVTEGAHLRSDRELIRPPDPDHVFGSQTVVDLLGSHAARVIRDTGVFQDLEPVRVGKWHADQLPHIARQAGLRHLLGMEVRHFYALGHRQTLQTQDFDTNLSTGTVTSGNTEFDGKFTYSFESTVIRFRLFEVHGDEVRVLWQMSTRASRGSPKQPVEISGGETAADCLRQLAAGLDELARRFSPDALTAQ